MAKFKHRCFEERVAWENKPGVEGKNATHHMKMYRFVREREKPTVVEFGTQRGIDSTNVLLTGCEEAGGRMVSVDIDDCSGVAESPNWTFIQSDDRDVDAILAKAPWLADGIDLLHIDSLHEEEHVKTLLARWFRYVKQGGYITFHDVDNTPFLPGRRKARPNSARNVAGVNKAVMEFFFANEDDLFLEIHYGSTGLAIMQKLGEINQDAKPPEEIQQWPNHPGVTESARLFVNALGRFTRAKVKK